MGMTDRQFDSYKAKLLRILKKAAAEVKEKGESQELVELIDELEAELRKP